MAKPAHNLLYLGSTLGRSPGERETPAFSPGDVPRSMEVLRRMYTECRSFKNRSQRRLGGCPPRCNGLQLQQTMDRRSIEAVLQCCGLAAEYAKQEAVFLWPEVVGQLAAYAEASFVREGVLHVVADNSSATQELNLLAPELLLKLNRELHGEKLHGIRVLTGDVQRPRTLPRTVHGNTPAAKEEALFVDIADPKLRAVLAEVYHRQRNRERRLAEHGGRPCPRCGVTYTGRDDVCPGCRYDTIEESSQEN